MIKVIYHKDCKDGHAAAMAIWLLHKNGAEYTPAAYGEKLDLSKFETHDDVFIVDFSYPRQELLELKAKVNSLIVLDHHKTAQEALAGLDFAIFDIDKSGCRLAWEHFHAGMGLPPLFQHIEDRDLWRFRLPSTKPVCAALDCLPQDFDEWLPYLYTTDLLVDRGRAILAYNEGIIKVALNNAFLGYIDGQYVPIANSAWLWSEIGDALCKAFPDAPFSATFYFINTNDGSRKVKWSLRSQGGFDVSAVAKKFGGGGHPGAAGFVSDFEFLRAYFPEHRGIYVSDEARVSP